MKKSLLLAALLLLAGILVACTTTETITVVETVTVVDTIEVQVTTDSGEVETQIVEVTRVDTVEVVVTATPGGGSDAGPAPVTLNWNLGSEPPTLDPALSTDTTSVDLVANLFVGLTVFDPITGEVMPYLATDWDVSDDGTVYTFHLRDDIAWIHYNPDTGETHQVTDADGNPLFVNAHDVVYGVKRTIDPATASDYSYVLYIIKNAFQVNNGDEGFTTDDIGVQALDDWTVEFTLEHAASYFPAIAGMWVAKPQPQWTIDEWHDQWTEANLISTNGPYALAKWTHGGEITLVKNPLWINADAVQIERIEMAMIVESSTAFAMYENNELDTTGVPSAEVDRVKADPELSAQYRNAAVTCTYYYGFVNNKPPFDDVRVRRAFAQSVDRQSLIDNVIKGGQLPATTFAPPGIFGAVDPSLGVGLEYDPEAAVASLQEYLDENGMTVEDFSAMGVVLMHNTSEGHARIAAAIQQMWADVLGVQVQVENQEWKVYLDTIRADTPIEEVPHVWRLGWCADYPDQNNWVHEVFNAIEGSNGLRRNCEDANCESTFASEFDELTAQAAQEQDPAVRAELYLEAERILAEEEAAYLPIYFYTSMSVTKPWLTRNFPALGGNDFYNWTVDMDAKLAAQGH